MSKIRIFLMSSVLAVCLAGCGYNGSYRYECQDPENWNKESCNPPTCLGYGECTNDIYGFDPREVTK
jgi:hypothetical protein